jgi:hypothetical protein
VGQCGLQDIDHLAEAQIMREAIDQAARLIRGRVGHREQRVGPLLS